MAANETLSYPVRKVMAAANEAIVAAGYSGGRTSKPLFGYYVTNRDAVTWDAVRRSQTVTETQQKLSTVSVCDRNGYETAVGAATRAYYKYTDPFGAKTYA